MVQQARVLVDYSGTMVKGLSSNVLYIQAPTGTVDMAPIRAAYFGLNAILPAGLVLTFPTSGDLVAEETGELTGAFTATSVSTSTGTGAATCAAGVGACVTWQTGMVVAGRRLRGRTFIVPLATDAYDNSGTLTTTAISALNTFGTAMNAIGGFNIWHRPTFSGVKPNKVNNADGAARLVAGHVVRDKVAYLTSRRD